MPPPTLALDVAAVPANTRKSEETVATLLRLASSAPSPRGGHVREVGETTAEASGQRGLARLTRGKAVRRAPNAVERSFTGFLPGERRVPFPLIILCCFFIGSTLFLHIFPLFHDT